MLDAAYSVSLPYFSHILKISSIMYLMLFATYGLEVLHLGKGVCISATASPEVLQLLCGMLHGHTFD